jgi:hypothetical protein
MRAIVLRDGTRLDTLHEARAYIIALPEKRHSSQWTPRSNDYSRRRNRAAHKTSTAQHSPSSSRFYTRESSTRMDDPVAGKLTFQSDDLRRRYLVMKP